MRFIVASINLVFSREKLFQSVTTFGFVGSASRQLYCAGDDLAGGLQHLFASVSERVADFSGAGKPLLLV